MSEVTVPAPAPEPAPTPDPVRPQGWWRRNRWALLALVALLPLALLTHSFGWQTSYRLTHSAEPVRAKDGVAHLVEPAYAKDETLTREVDVSVVAHTVVPSVDGWTLAPGTELHRFTLHFAAPTSSPLFQCRVALADAQGRTYTTGLGVRDKDGSPGPMGDCVPQGAEGPQIGFDGLYTTTNPRPEQWDMKFVVVVPVDSPPTHVRVWWSFPRYAEVPL